jgi:hypothetical protein
VFLSSTLYSYLKVLIIKTHKTFIKILEAIFKLHGHIHIEDLQAELKYKHYIRSCKLLSLTSTKWARWLKNATCFNERSTVFSYPVIILSMHLTISLCIIFIYEISSKKSTTIKAKLLSYFLKQVILVFRFMQMSHIECWKFSNISANTVVASCHIQCECLERVDLEASI